MKSTGNKAVVVLLPSLQRLKVECSILLTKCEDSRDLLAEMVRVFRKEDWESTLWLDISLYMTFVDLSFCLFKCEKTTTKWREDSREPMYTATCNAIRTCVLWGQVDKPGLSCLIMASFPTPRITCQEAGGRDLGWKLGWVETEASKELRPHWGTLSEENSYRLSREHVQGCHWSLKDRTGHQDKTDWKAMTIPLHDWSTPSESGILNKWVIFKLLSPMMSQGCVCLACCLVQCLAQSGCSGFQKYILNNEQIKWRVPTSPCILSSLYFYP